MAIVKAKYIRGKSRIKAHLRYSNSRSALKILCDLCRTPLAEPCDDLFLAFVTTGWASIDVRLSTQPLLACVDVELRHSHGIPEKTVASKDGSVRRRGSD